MNRTDRLYAIVEELRLAAPGGRSSTWLADRFEVSVRTMKRDVAALMEAGVPVVGLEGRAGGYRLLRTTATAPITFTAGEATAVAVALAAEPRLPFAPDGRAALTKVLRAMDERQRADAEQLASRVWMLKPSITGRTESVRRLDESLRDQAVVNIDYRDRNGRVSRRRPIEPMAFARTDDHWYVLAWCRRSEAGRWFRLDRILAARPTRERFEERVLDDVFGQPPDDARPVDLGTGTLG